MSDQSGGEILSEEERHELEMLAGFPGHRRVRIEAPDDLVQAGQPDTLSTLDLDKLTEEDSLRRAREWRDG